MKKEPEKQQKTTTLSQAIELTCEYLGHEERTFLWFFLHGLSIHMLTLLLVTGLLLSVVSLVLSSWPQYSHVNSITCDRGGAFCCFSGSFFMA
jgi:hypothetical protein